MGINDKIWHGGWKKDEDGYMVFDNGEEVKDIANLIGVDGEIMHIQNVDRVIHHCAKQRAESGGWAPDRSMRRYASIPLVDWMNHPEFAYDDKALEAWLCQNPQYRTVEESHGKRSANVIIK